MAAYTAEKLYYKLDNMVLSTCSHLREVFKIRWKEQTQSEWIDDQYHKNKLIESLISLDSKLKKCSLKTFQQASLKRQPLAEWDMSLLSDILLLQSPENEKSRQENEAIRNLKTIRNVLAHNDIGNHTSRENDQISRHCTQTEYELYSRILRESLISLNIEEREINKLIELAGVTSSLKAVERAKALYTDAETLVAKKRFQEALEICSDALDTPSLLPEHRGEAFEKRAECYLKYSFETGNDFSEKVQLDVKEALKLNKSSWFANYLAARCYRHKYNIGQAIIYYELALFGTTVPNQVKLDLKCCRILAGMHCNEECISPLLICMNLDKQFKQLEKETGIKMEKRELKSFFRKIGKVIPGQDHVLLGHVHFAGWNVPQNFTEAIQHYAKADRIGNLEGSFNLGKCYHFGCGVDQDVVKAMEIYQAVEYKGRSYGGRETASRSNIGVAYSQYSIGTMYAEGVGVYQNLKEAMVWYKEAFKNGVEFAAYELGNLFARGKGVPLDEEMAEYFWLKAVDLRDVNAPASLVAYYIRKRKPDKAINMIQIGRKLGNEHLMNIQDEEFYVVK